MVIDTDPGIDDAAALALAAASPELDVVAVTTVFGNVDVARSSRNARAVMRRAELRAPVIAGAAAPLVRPADPPGAMHGAEGLGYVRPDEPPRREPDEAADALVQLSRVHHGLAVCAIGPLTNLARALARDPGLAARLGPVVVMGGALRVPGSSTRAAEFNWWSDPEAAQAVLATALEVRVVPLDVTGRITLPAEDVRALRASADPVARFWGDALDYRLARAREEDPDAGCPLHDPLAVALLVAPELAVWRAMRLAVETTDGERRGVVSESSDARPARVAVDVVSAGDLVKLLRERLVPRLRWQPLRDARGGGTTGA